MGGEYMVEIEELKDRVGYIEREKIVKIEEDIMQIKMGQVETNTLVKEFTRAIDSQGETMKAMTTSLQEITYTNKRLIEDMSEVKGKIDQTNENIKCVEENTNAKFEEVDTKIELQDEKSKIDLLTFIKENWLRIVIGATMVWLGLERVGVIK